MISFKQLNYALAVAETLHFKKAAEQCHVSQSALSSSIQEMEAQLGFQVFERDNRKVLVTTLGQAFLAKAGEIRVQMEDLNQMSQRFAKPLSYPVSLGVIPTIGPYLLPKVLPSVRQNCPDLELRIEEEQSHVLVQKVRNGELDIGVLALPYDVSGLLSFDFWDEDFYVVTHAKDPLAGRPEVSRTELLDAQLLLLKDGHCLKDHALAVCQLPDSNGNHSLEGTSLYTLVQMVAGKMGITLVPQLSLDQLVEPNPELSSVALDEPGPHRKLAFICRPNYAGVNNIEALKEMFLKQLH